ncbi:CBS domain-containing protein [Roseiterribacter gracilis]|uniref:Inosine-5-monophosphate dehydrogenase n=1 Tax=Roseiterribacter gracilis TaxID=2812848 RepID=A0A8S8XDT6_9PROT|nr:inosine-5-monophosphate dehydrogenase [Rhodospirillales bacterium TMPK1]
MTVRAMLKGKSGGVITIRPESSLRDAIALLSQRRIGAVVVSGDGEKVDGILSERDLVHAMHSHGTSLLDRQVKEIMTKDVITCAPEMALTQVMETMTRGRFRHLPVLENGKLIGIVSIGDAVKSRLSELESETTQLRAYIAGG